MTPAPVPAGATTTLYRFYDADDRLLYVGISERGPERWRAHRKDKPWWTEVVRTTTEHYDNRAAALEAERAAIIAEQPAYNVVHNRGCVATSMPAAPGQQRAHTGAAYCQRSEAIYEVCTRRGFRTTTDLQLYYEVLLDPISDDWLPTEISAIELLERWAPQAIRAAAATDRSCGPFAEGWVPIFWYVSGRHVFETAPDAPNRQSEWGDFSTHYLPPIDTRTGRTVHPRQLPVVSKAWTADKSDKGGFITEATGWSPAAYQPLVNVHDLLYFAELAA
jgi:hypothetical protein